MSIPSGKRCRKSQNWRTLSKLSMIGALRVTSWRSEAFVFSGLGWGWTSDQMDILMANSNALMNLTLRLIEPAFGSGQCKIVMQ